MTNFDLHPSCIKCGKDDVNLSHHDIQNSSEAMLYAVVEFLKCKCKTCGFSWPMKTKDTKEEIK